MSWFHPLTNSGSSRRVNHFVNESKLKRLCKSKQDSQSVPDPNKLSMRRQMLVMRGITGIYCMKERFYLSHNGGWVEVGVIGHTESVQ